MAGTMAGTIAGTNVARRRGRGRPSSFVGNNLVVRDDDDDFDGERNRRRGRRRAGTSARRRGVGRRCGGSPRGASASSSKNDDDDDLYAILNLSPPYESLSKKDIKTAYRKRALETHPDRNKKPNATEEFNRCKQAYNTLSDDKLREEYDRKRRFWAKNGGDGRRRTASASSSAAYGREPKTTEEPFYGFSDFFRDVEKEFEERERRKGRDPSKPKSLWEELEMLGEEFVEFLEENERNDFHNYDATETTTERMRAEAASKTSSNRNRNNGSSSSSSSRSSSSSSAEGFKTSNAGATTRKAKDESVEDMLRELKRKMGKE